MATVPSEIIEMSIYKLHRCRSCHYKRRGVESIKLPCPHCNESLYASKNFYFNYWVDGKKKEKSAGPLKSEAIRAERKMKVEISEGKYIDPVSWPSAVKTLGKTYRNLSPKTVEMYQNSLSHLFEFFERLKLTDIRDHHLEEYKDSRLEAGISGASFNRERSTLRRMFSLSGVAWNFRKTVFTAELETARDRFLDEDERARLMEACKKHDLLFCAILVALDTGLRKTPILTLQWRDISFKENLITKEGKGGKVHRIPLTQRLRDHLIKYRAKQKVLSMWVFPGSDIGQPIKDIRKSFAAACREAGVPDIRFHDLRRSFASSLVMATKDLALVQELLGHSSVETTKKHYAHLIDGHKRGGIELYEKYTSRQRS